MHSKFRNVNEAFKELVTLFCHKSLGEVHRGDRVIDVLRSTSRNGDVLYIQEPVIVTYMHPRERVLFNQARDCNPFFHLYEALWMLAGRNDVAPLAYYNSNIANYSDDGQTFNGAYGYRWRKAACDSIAGEFDQLRILINHLKAVPDSRRAVLQMWNVEDDLLKIGGGKGCERDHNNDGDCDRHPKGCPSHVGSKDVCCNTHVYFSIREVSQSSNGSNLAAWLPNKKYLDMTVCNRSNDLIWGLLGANAGHFSFLQEYMAACIGVEVGVYNQITNNCHVYLNDKWQPEKWLAKEEEDGYPPGNTEAGLFGTFPLVKDPQQFDKELPVFVETHKKGLAANDLKSYTEPFLQKVALPMCVAFYHHKCRDYDDALNAIRFVTSDDWRIAGTNWLLKRKAKYENRTVV